MTDVTVNVTAGPSCQPAPSSYVAKAYHVPVGSLLVNARVADSVTGPPAWIVIGACCGAMSRNGPPALVPPGGRSAITIALIETAALVEFLYVTVPCWVWPGITVARSRESGAEIANVPVA